MDTKEKLQRIMFPTCLEDYGLVVDLRDVARECPEVFTQEIAPFLPADAVAELPVGPES